MERGRLEPLGQLGERSELQMSLEGLESYGALAGLGLLLVCVLQSRDGCEVNRLHFVCSEVLLYHLGQVHPQSPSVVTHSSVQT